MEFRASKGDIAQESVAPAGTGLRTGSGVAWFEVAAGVEIFAEESRAFDPGFPLDVQDIPYGDAAHGTVSAVADEARARPAAGE